MPERVPGLSRKGVFHSPGLQQATAEILEFAAYRRHPPVHAAEASPSSHTSEALLFFSITVDESLTSELKEAILKSGGNSVSSLWVEPLSLKHLSKTWIHMKAAAFRSVLHAIIAVLPGAELGPVVHISPLRAQTEIY
jgi:hypothetical protein